MNIRPGILLYLAGVPICCAGGPKWTRETSVRYPDCAARSVRHISGWLKSPAIILK